MQWQQDWKLKRYLMAKVSASITCLLSELQLGWYYSKVQFKEPETVTFFCVCAIFNKAGLKPWLSTIDRTRNEPRTSREKISIKILKERGTIIHFMLLLASQNGKTWNIQSKFFKFRASAPVVILMLSIRFSASLHWYWCFYENWTPTVDFRCCKCFLYSWIFEVILATVFLW